MLSPSTEELTTGTWRSACTAARQKKVVKVRREPVRCSKAAFSRSRNCTMRVMSTSKTECTCALVRLDSTMRSAIFLRMALMGTTSPGRTAAAGAMTAGAGMAGAAAARVGAGGSPAAGAPAPCFSRKLMMSCLEMRPPRPVPGTCARLMLFSLAMRRTSGEERTRPPSSPGNSITSRAAAAGAAAGLAAGAGAGAGAGLAAGDGAGALGASALAGAGGGAATTAAPSASITPTTVFTCTVVPSATLISLSTPAAGAGISASTLSVEISNRGSSRCTLSPGFFSHLVSVPSKIDSPIWGMITSVGIASSPQE